MHCFFWHYSGVVLYLLNLKPESRHGFTGGNLLYYPITEAFGVQQVFLYTNKGSGQDITMTQPPLSTSTNYKLNYFEFPILFHHTFVNVRDFGIYGSTGFGLPMLLNGDYNVDGSIDMGGGPVSIDESGSTDGLDKFDYSFLYGLGFNFNFLNQTYSFSLGIIF